MALRIASINSGSNGNCYYIENDTDALLVDAGISCRETERRMNKLGLDMKKVRAIFVSHEHHDHITGIPALSKKYQLPVYITPGTLGNSQIPIEPQLICHFTADRAYPAGSLQVRAFSKWHDAADPHSFVVSYQSVHVGVFTDIGYCCAEVKKYFKACHAVFLETNYCEHMLAASHYPLSLQRRISGRTGHLSNRQAFELYQEHAGPHLSHLILSHLSKNNNTPEKAAQLFLPAARQVQITVASRYQESELMEITGIPAALPALAVGKKERPAQLSLFGS